MKVKVPVNLVIAGLERRLAENREITARNDQIRAKYDEAQKSWAEQVSKLSLEVDSVSAHSWREQVSITYKVPQGTPLPKEPERGNLESELGQHEINEIANAIRILGMSEDEYVSASTMKEIGRYL